MMDGLSWGILGFMALLACPLMMGGMLLFGWFAVKRTSDDEGHSGHRIGCHPMMGHGSTGPEQREKHSRIADER